MSNLYARRQSVRAFKPDAIPEEVVGALLEAAVAAPSAGNCQPWHFYVVNNPNVKAQLHAAAYRQSFLLEAPLVLAVCAEEERSAERYGERGRELYVLQDTAAAIENVLLCAVEQGLASCWCGAFDEAAAGAALGVPAGRRPIALLAIGYAAKEGKKPPRRPMAEVVTRLD